MGFERSTRARREQYIHPITLPILPIPLRRFSLSANIMVSICKTNYLADVSYSLTIVNMRLGEKLK